MELPVNLKEIYRHWSLHTIPPEKTLLPGDVFVKPELFEEVSWFINERMSVWKKKVSGSVSPYTDDPVLQKYRFCNIFREFDKQTIVFHTLLNPIRDDFPLWLLNMFYCRMVARPETIQRAGLLSFNSAENEMVYKKLMDTPRSRFGTPYVFPVSVILKSKTPTRELFITSYLPSVMKEVAQEIADWQKESVYDGVEKILPIFSYNLHFLWTEVLIDVAYQFPHYIDLFAQFPVGPGSAPTMQRINPDEDPSVLVAKLSQIPFDTGVTYNNKPLRLSAENWEGIGCEFRKYTNLKSGNGRKRLFNTSQ